jgi:hypothetical protein
MSASDDIKEQIVCHYVTMGLVTSEKDWKRLSKKKVGFDIVREFENKNAGLKVAIVGDDEAEVIIEDGEWIYGVGTMDPDHVDDHGETDMYVSFSSRQYWNAVGAIPDQHIGHGLKILKNLPNDIACNEDMENWFGVPGNYNRLTIHMALKKAGFVYDKAFEDFIQPNAGPAAHIVGTRPTFTSVGSAAGGSAPSGGYYDTGLTPGATKPSDFVFAVMKQQGTGDVEVMITALQDFLHDGGFDQEISCLVEAHLPSDWHETSEQTFIPGQMTAKEAYNFLYHAGFNANRDYSETFESHGYCAYFTDNECSLENQPQVVRDAIEHQNLTGQHGLPKDNNSWLDRRDIISEYEDNDKEEFTLERSNALYILYSEYDDGCHSEIPDFTSLSNDDLVDALEEVIDDVQFTVIADTVQYGDYYTVNAPALNQVTEATEDTSPDENAPIHINTQPDNWDDFCKEVWDAWVAKPGDALRIQWVDSYRYREATIVGLAYKFKVVEYTGIWIQAGYLLDDGAIAMQFEVPDSVFEAMFTEFGGSWNDDRTEHFVNKRKGEDEHGFSYSSSTLWDEVKPILDAKGWKEVE